jgi:hypothetical protein
MSFTPALGILVEYKGSVGEIKFIDDVYLTICTKSKTSGMIGDLCLVVYREEWDIIKMLGSPHRQ